MCKHFIKVMIVGTLSILLVIGVAWYEFHDRLPTDREVTAMLFGIPFGVLLFLGATYETRRRRLASSHPKKIIGGSGQSVLKTTLIIICIFMIGSILGEQGLKLVGLSSMITLFIFILLSMILWWLFLPD
jgi:hypothetical protein